MQTVCVWLTDRLELQLHSFQLRTLITVVKVRPLPLPPPPLSSPSPTSSLPSASAPVSEQKTYRDFRLQGILAASSSSSYQSVYRRLTVEEATMAVKAGDALQGVSMRDSDEEDL